MDFFFCPAIRLWDQSCMLRSHCARPIFCYMFKRTDPRRIRVWIPENFWRKNAETEHIARSPCTGLNFLSHVWDIWLAPDLNLNFRNLLKNSFSARTLLGTGEGASTSKIWFRTFYLNRRFCVRFWVFLKSDLLFPLQLIYWYVLNPQFIRREISLIEFSWLYWI